MDVTIEQGCFRGELRDGVASFKGIPYAAAPVGAARFQPPAPPASHAGVRDATDWGPTVSTPPQRSAVIDALLPDPVRPGDDGLNLNIWTPDLRGRQPVLVFVHGGGFATGAGSTTAFDGTAFARDGVVAVTINYRLAVEGFLALPGAVPNRGLLDQVAALEWVRDNIAAFGGDPAAVTVAGESAGAMSVLTLLAMPRARGLVARAISQSGDGHHVHAPAEGALVVDAMCEALGIDATVEAFLEVPQGRLHATTNEVIATLTAGRDPRYAAFTRLALQPVIDGEVLPRHPVDAARDRDSADVSLLIGTNADEYGLFAAPTGLPDLITEEMLLGTVARLGVDAAAVVAAYRSQMPGADLTDLFIAIQSDWFCGVPTARYVEARAAAGADSHVYEFAWRPPTYDGRLGACHTLELPFVFDTLDDPWGRALRGPDAPQQLADEVHGAWVAFVRDGDPGWPVHGARRTVRRFDHAGGGGLVDDPQPWRRAAWGTAI